MSREPDQRDIVAVAQMLGEINALRHLVEVLYTDMFQRMPDPVGAAHEVGRHITKTFDATFERKMTPLEAMTAQFTLTTLERAFDSIEGRLR